MFKKIISPVLTFAFVTSFFFFQGTSVFAQRTPYSVLIPTAEMRTPLIEAKDLDSCLLSLINTVGSVVSGGGLTGGGCSWDSIAWMAAKALTTIEFNGMVKMVQTGYFDTGTSWLDNPQSYYSSVNTETTDYFFANDYNNSTLLPTIKGNVRSSILRRETTPFTQSISSGMDFPGGESGYQAFLADWNACPTGNPWDCYAALQSPKNDAFSVQMRTQQELSRVQNTALTHATNEVLAGSGYRDVKTNCVYGHYIGCVSQTPGSTLEAQINDYLSTSNVQLTSADELDETVTTAVQNLYGVMVNWLNNKSLSGL